MLSWEKTTTGVPKPVIVGVAGGTGSGKTTVVSEILKGLKNREVTVIQHDSYYKDRRYLSIEARSDVNYDHPDALETSLLVDHLHQLLTGRSVNVPVYDFATHTRKPETVTALVPVRKRSQVSWRRMTASRSSSVSPWAP